jgi:hypothetical protein
MALFIPEWQRVSGSELHIKRVLAALDDAHVIRRPLRAQAGPADLFVQHPAKGWLALAVSPLTFAELDPAQLFDSPRRTEFEQRMAALSALGREDERSQHGMAVLVVMSSCTSDETRLLAREHLLRHGARLVSREQFMQLGIKLVGGLLEPMSEHCTQALLGRLFPEAEIAPEQTTQRWLLHDNSARLKRFFLDSQQEWAVKLDLDVPDEQAQAIADFSLRLVNGVAGSGKTLIAVHRALLLTELFPAQRVLLLIHNTPIVADLMDRLRRTRGALPPQLKVMTFFAWAARQWHCMFGHWPEISSDLPALVRHHRLRWPELKLDDGPLVDEIDFIDESLISSQAEYLAAKRIGRGFALRAGEREQIWALREAVAASLKKRGEMAWSALPAAIVAAHRRHAALERRDHILIDEAQFFAPSWFAVVKLSLAPRGQLFLCADPKQGFMRHRLSWKSAGLDVAGRTKKLSRSYRTTRTLLESASAMAGSLAPDDTDDEVQPDYAGMETGVRPLLLYAASPQDAMDRLVNEIDVLAGEGLPLDAFLVVFGDNVNRRALCSQLVRRLGPRRVWQLNESAQKKAPPGVDGADCLRVAYLDTATGLEGIVVFLIGIEGLFADEAADADEHRDERLRKLYMAMTRAGQKLVLLSSHRLPEAIEALFDRPDELPRLDS